MNKRLLMVSLILLLFFNPHKVNAQPPPLIYRIGGTITINNKPMTLSIFSRYNFSIKVTKMGNIPLDPVAETSSLTSNSIYIIDIPVKDEFNPGGATPGETLEIHVYQRNNEVKVTIPVNGEIIMGTSGYSGIVNISITGHLPNALPAINLLLMDE